MKESLKMRLDLFILNQKLVSSREKAKEQILNGEVLVNGNIINKPSFKASIEDDIVITKTIKYVSRGGVKLEKALKVFDINPLNSIALDVGASTGGFTDCLLQHGSSKIFALDVGSDQLDLSLVNNEKVINLEKTHIKELSKTLVSKYKIDIVTIDVSFISVRKAIPYIVPYITEDTDIICLLKPQFEIGKTNKGIVRSIKEHKKVVYDNIAYMESLGFGILGFDFSPVLGSKGNIEFLLYLKRNNESLLINYKEIIISSHKIFKGRC